MWRHSPSSGLQRGPTSTSHPLTSPPSFSSTFTSYDFVPLLLIWPLLGWALIYFAPPILSGLLRVALSFVSQPNEEGGADEAPAAYVVPGSTSHSRLLPVSAKHSFRYPTLYLGVELEALEKKRLDRKWIFKYKRQAAAAAVAASDTALEATKGDDDNDDDDASLAQQIARQADVASSCITDLSHRYTLSSLDPSAYLRTSFPDVGPKSSLHVVLSSSIRSKLAWELRHRGYLSLGPQDAPVDSVAGWEERGVKEMGQVWMITMPSLVGIQGINPLTVYYVHKPSADKGKRGDFWLCILEVHNTFSERHVYILENGVAEDLPVEAKEDKDGSGGERLHATHRWTFPRSFHVSPFNDRGGWYRLTLKELFSRDASAKDGKPLVSIQLRLLIPADGEMASKGSSEQDHDDKGMSTPSSISRSPIPANLQLKLLATLNSSSAKVKPFSALNYATSVARQPFDLLLPFLRIMKEAARLHWKRGLRVWVKPELRELGEGDGAEEGREDRVGNEVQLLRQSGKVAARPGRGGGRGEESKRAGALFYQPETSGERTARLFVEKALRRRLQAQATTTTMATTTTTGESIEEILIRPTDPGGKGLHLVASTSNGAEAEAKSTATSKKIEILTRSQQVFTDLVLWPSFRVAELVAMGCGRRWVVLCPSSSSSSSTSSEDGRVSLDLSEDDVKGSEGVWDRAADWVRMRHLQWALSCAGIEGEGERSEALRLLGLDPATRSGGSLRTLRLPPHPLSSAGTTPTIVVLLLRHHLLARLEKALSERIGVRYVKGLEPWKDLGRALRVAKSEAKGVVGGGMDGEGGETGEGEPWDEKLGSSSWIDEP